MQPQVSPKRLTVAFIVVFVWAAAVSAQQSMPCDLTEVRACVHLLDELRSFPSVYLTGILTGHPLTINLARRKECLRDAIVPINSVATMPGLTVRARATDHWRLRCVFAGRNCARRRRLLKTEK